MPPNDFAAKPGANGRFTNDSNQGNAGNGYNDVNA